MNNDDASTTTINEWIKAEWLFIESLKKYIIRDQHTF